MISLAPSPVFAGYRLYHPNLEKSTFKQLCIHSRKHSFPCLNSVSLRFGEGTLPSAPFLPLISLITKNKNRQQTFILMAQIPTELCPSESRVNSGTQST